MNLLKSTNLFFAVILLTIPFQLLAQASNDSLLTQLSRKWTNAKAYALKMIEARRSDAAALLTFADKLVTLSNASGNVANATAAGIASKHVRRKPQSNKDEYSEVSAS